jgi:hypothetical protein
VRSADGSSRGHRSRLQGAGMWRSPRRSFPGCGPTSTSGRWTDRMAECSWARKGRHPSGSFQVTWSKAVEKAGVPGLRFHDLGHTGNTLAAEEASLRELMARMGHNSARAALVYQHASRDREQAIGAAISARIEAERSEAKGHDRGTATGSRRKGPKEKRTRERSDQGRSARERVTGIEPA